MSENPAEGRPHSTARLALFAAAMTEQAALSSPVSSLRPHFPLQQPVIFFPGLDTREIHDSRRFPWVAALESACPTILAELDALLAGAELARVNRDYTQQGEWAAAYLWAFGEQVEETCRRCPETARLLAAIPGVSRFGVCLFSALAPHSRITPHHGATNAVLRCQLPLRVPGTGACKLKVGDHEIEQRAGRCIIFDDSFLHSAWNDSDEARFVLVFDFFHPGLTDEEIEYLVNMPARQAAARHHLRQAAGPKVTWGGSRTGPEKDSR